MICESWQPSHAVLSSSHEGLSSNLAPVSTLAALPVSKGDET